MSTSMVLWAVFCWETLGPAIHVDITLKCTTFLGIVVDHVHPFMETVLPDAKMVGELLGFTHLHYAPSCPTDHLVCPPMTPAY